MKFNSAIPTLRIFDEAKAREFYLDFLGFEISFEHRFQKDFPLFLGIVKGGCVLYLSEHHGDACPGAQITIPMIGLDEYNRELLAKEYTYAKPGINKLEWGAREMSITDPFGNRLNFNEEVQKPE